MNLLTNKEKGFEKRLSLLNTSDTSSDLLAGIICLLFAIYYWSFSNISEGFYQHDEVGHYFQILDFWNSPMRYLLDMWSRGGYKMLYSIPGLFGRNTIVLTNIFFAAGSCWLTYLIAKKYELKYAWMTVVFLGTQPLFLQLSFRCFAEIPTMFFTTLSIYLYLNNRYLATALLVSFLFTLRQEMAVFALLLGTVFLFQKKWIPFLLLGIAPLLLNFLGWMKLGDPLFILHMMKQGGMEEGYRRNGFYYLWLMLPEISGVIVFYFFLTAAFSLLLSKNIVLLLKKYITIIVVFGVYFIMHCILTSEFMGVGRSGGLARFLLVVTPIISIVAVGGLNFLLSKSRMISHKIVVSALSFIALILVYVFYDTIMPLVFNGYQVLTYKTENTLVLGIVVVFSLLLAFLPKIKTPIIFVIAFISIIYSILYVKPMPTFTEDLLSRKASNWIKENDKSTSAIYCNHVLIKYFYMKDGGDFNSIQNFDSSTVINAKRGDIFISENHYSRNFNVMLFNFQQFGIVNAFESGDYPFKVFIVVKR